MTREDEIKNIALCYAHDELKDSQSPIEDVVAAAFIDGVNYADQYPHWISVEDKFPPMRDEDGMSDKVLTHSKGGGIYFNRYDYGHNTWGNPIAFNVTHWMHLSPPPVLSNSENTGKDMKGGGE